MARSVSCGDVRWSPKDLSRPELSEPRPCAQADKTQQKGYAQATLSSASLKDIVEVKRGRTRCSHASFPIDASSVKKNDGEEGGAQGAA